jgi:branched-chain amino acid transport system ATP-binding protein
LRIWFKIERAQEKLFVYKRNDHTTSLALYHMDSEILKANSLSKYFGGLAAVSELNLSLQTNKITSVIGPNGAGKTTLFNLINGILRPDSGDVVFLDKVITGLNPYQIAQLGISRTFQTLNVFGRLSVFENVRAGILWKALPRREEEKRVYKMLDRLGIPELADENILDITPVSRRLVEVGRALISEPKLLLFDEIMAGFSEAESLSLIEVIRDFCNRGITFCIIGHTMRAIMSVSDNVIVMDAGKKFAEGTTKEIQENEAVQRIYLGESADA